MPNKKTEIFTDYLNTLPGKVGGSVPENEQDRIAWLIGRKKIASEIFNRLRHHIHFMPNENVEVFVIDVVEEDEQGFGYHISAFDGVKTMGSARPQKPEDAKFAALLGALIGEFDDLSIESYFQRQQCIDGTVQQKLNDLNMTDSLDSEWMRENLSAEILEQCSPKKSINGLKEGYSHESLDHMVPQTGDIILCVRNGAAFLPLLGNRKLAKLIPANATQEEIDEIVKKFDHELPIFPKEKNEQLQRILEEYYLLSTKQLFEGLSPEEEQRIISLNEQQATIRSQEFKTKFPEEWGTYFPRKDFDERSRD